MAISLDDLDPILSLDALDPIKKPKPLAPRRKLDTATESLIGPSVVDQAISNVEYERTLAPEKLAEKRIRERVTSEQTREVFDDVRAKQIASEPKYQSFGKALLAGIDDTQKLIFAGTEAIGEVAGGRSDVGAQDRNFADMLAATGKEGRESNTREADQYGRRGEFSQINSVGDAFAWATQTAGNMIPVMVPAMAGGAVGAMAAPAAGVTATVGGVIGAFIPSLVVSTGEVQANAKDKDPSKTANGWTFAGGTAIAALDSVLPGRIGGKLIEKFGRDAAEEIALRALLRPAGAKLGAEVAKGALKEGGKSAAIEGLTESVQEAIGEVAASLASESKIDWKGLPKQMLEAGAAGALMGAGTGGPSGAITAAKDVADANTMNQGYQAGVNRDAAGASLPAATSTDPADFSSFVDARNKEVVPDPKADVPLTDADRASPLPDDLIQAGKNRIADVTGVNRPPRAAPPPAGATFDRMVQIVLGLEGGGTLANPKTSPKGAQGPMQVMPGTNSDPGFGVRPAQDNSEAERARVGRDYLAAMMRRYGGDPAKALAAYNAGPGAVDQRIKALGDNWLGDMPAETRKYVMGGLGKLGQQAFNPETGEVAPQPVPEQAELDSETSEDFVKRVLGQDVFDAAPNTEPALTSEDLSLENLEAKAAALTEAPVGEIEQQGADMRGEDINSEFANFSENSGSLGVPRAEMPQIKAENRGALVNYLKARNVTSQEEIVPSAILKPTQQEFSPAKVQKAKEYTGGNRAILVSSDGYVLDGHHQWLAARDNGEDIRTLKLGAPIEELIPLARDFPSSELAEGAQPVDITPAEEVTGAEPRLSGTGRKPIRKGGGFGTFLEYLADIGGVRDDEGHSLSKQRALQQGIAGAGSLIRTNGRSIDEIGEKAFEDGWFPSRPTTTQVLQLIDDAQFKKIYHPAESVERGEEKQAEDQEAFADRLQSVAKEIDAELNEDEMRYAASKIKEGRTVEGAVMAAVEWSSARELPAILAATNDSDYDLPFDGEAVTDEQARKIDESLSQGSERPQVASEPAREREAAIQEPSGDSQTEITDTPTGKGVVVRGASEAQLAAIKAALPEKASGMVGKDGAVTYSKKHEDKIKAALAGSTVSPRPDFAGAVNRDLSNEQVDAVAAIFDRAEKRGKKPTAPETADTLVERAQNVYKYILEVGGTDLGDIIKPAQWREQMEEGARATTANRYPIKELPNPFGLRIGDRVKPRSGARSGESYIITMNDVRGQLQYKIASTNSYGGWDIEVEPYAQSATPARKPDPLTKSIFSGKLDQADIFATGQASAKSVQEARDHIQNMLFRFASGMSAPKDLIAGGYAAGGSDKLGIGVDIGELSVPSVKKLAAMIVDIEARTFVDSGAFSLFKKGLKEDGVEALDFNKIIGRYESLVDNIVTIDPAEKFPESPTGTLLLVMPDIVGDQAGSLELLSKHKAAIRQWTYSGSVRAIVPLQTGDRSLSKAYNVAVNSLGTEDFVVGIPANEAAVSPEELREFIRTTKPKGLHFLGAISPTKLGPKMDALAEALAETGHRLTHLSADANLLRSRLYGTQGDDRGATVQGVIENADRALGSRNARYDEAAPAAQQETEAAPAKVPDSFFAKNKVVTGDRVAAAKARMKDRMNRLNSGVDPEMISDGMIIAAGYIEAGMRNFAEFAKAMQADFGTEIYPYLLSFWEGARNYPGINNEGMTPPDVSRAIVEMITADANPAAVAPAQPSEEIGQLETSDRATLMQAFMAAFREGRGFATITEARALASETLGRKIEAGTADAKMLDEAIETSVIQTARVIAVENSDDAYQAYQRLVGLYARQPKLTVRTSTSVEQQAYSTPVPLSFLASRLAGINQNTTVYEPSAGNGALLIDSRATYTQANELNPDRAAALRRMFIGAKVTERDATEFAPEGKVDVVIGNPPFGPLKDDAGNSVEFDVGGNYITKEIDHAISMKALEAMKDGGSAVLIVGGINKQITDPKARADAYNGKAKREFYFRLYSEYNVVDHFTVDGSLYERQGAGWPVDLLVIKGRGKSALTLPAIRAPRQYDSWQDLAEVLKNGRPQEATGPVRATDGNATIEGSGPAAVDGANTGVSRRSADDRGSGRNTNEQPDSVRDGPVDGQPASDGVGRESEVQSAPVSDQRQRRADRSTDDVNPEASENARQVSYTPGSNANPMGTLVPVNMQTAIDDALDALRNRVGDIDEYVGQKLGYGNNALYNAFGAEQIDAIALAIDNIERGAGFIIGDQTGIGKGRVVAAVIRYAIRENRPPIFVTQMPDLYKDMFRDMEDIGLVDMLGRDINAVMTNSAVKLPLDDDETRFLKSLPAAKQQALLDKLTAEGLESNNVDVVMTTYSQMQTVNGEETGRMKFLRSLAGQGAVLILDESHNAGGTSAGMMKKKPGEAPNRAEFVRELVNISHGVFYSSATYAKRPDVMDLYAATDMRLAVKDPKDLGEAIAKGGVPMQQVVAAMLARSGQYVRRERSFDGINYNTPAIDVDMSQYAATAGVLAAIQDFSELYVGPATEVLSETLKAEAKSVSFDGSVGTAGATSTNFTSVMHNVIDQMLLAFSAEAAADMAIAAIKAKEKPVITVSNTLETMLKEFAAEAGVSNGEVIDITFANVFRRYLERTRWITVKKPFSAKGEKGERIRLTDNMLGFSGVAAFRDAMEMIDESGLDALPGSPVDYILSRINDAGYKVGEITGRTVGINYRNGKTYLKSRPTSEKSTSGKIKAVSGFNNGALDALLINRAASAGLSMHSSKNFKDQRKRRMILAQAEGNIDTHMQILGRIHRTGQTVLPEYDQIVINVPAAKRPAAVLAKKMASLNANTTASRDSALTSQDTIDFMNVYGDEVVANIMAEEPDIHRRLGEPLSGKEEDEGFSKEEAARRVTGRIPLLPVEQQEDLYRRIEEEYLALLEQKNAAGENALEAKTFELDAVTENSIEVVPAAQDAGDSPFGEAVRVEIVDVKRLGKPYPSSEVAEKVARAAGVSENGEPTEIIRNVLSANRRKHVDDTGEWVEKGKAWNRADLESIKDDKAKTRAAEKFADNLTTFRDIRGLVGLGEGVKLITENGNYYGIVTDLKRTGNSKNPLAPGSWKATFAVVDGARTFTFPFSQLMVGRGDTGGKVRLETADSLGQWPIIEAFDKMQTTGREKRSVVVGNMLAGFNYVNGRGSIINYTTDTGDVRQGIMMPKDFDLDKHEAKQGVSLTSPEVILAWLSEVREPIVGTGNTGGVSIFSNPYRNEFTVVAAKSKKVGGEFFLNARLIEALQTDFVSRSNGMVASTDGSNASAVIQTLLSMGVKFEIPGTAAQPTKDKAKELIARIGAAKPKFSKRSAGWTKDRIKNLLSQFGYGDDRRRTKAYAAKIAPQDFLSATSDVMARDIIERDTGPLDEAKLAGEIQPIFLNVMQSPDGANIFRIIGHEGRHRMTALRRAGVQQVPVVVKFEQGRDRPQLDSAEFLQQRQISTDTSNMRDFAVNGPIVPIAYDSRAQLETEFGEGDVKFSIGGGLFDEPAQPEKTMTDKQRAELEARQKQGMARKGGQTGLMDQEGGLFAGERDQGSLFSRPANRIEGFGRRVVESATGFSAPIVQNLRAELNKLGIGDRVTLTVAGKILDNSYIRGMYFQNVIQIATSKNPNPFETLNHEAIHALKDLGLFKPAEWRALETAARADKAMMSSIRSRYKGQGLTESELVEEGVADMFAAWRAGTRVERGFIRDAFERIVSLFRNLRRAIAGANAQDEAAAMVRQNALGVMESIASGELGSRRSPMAGLRQNASARAMVAYHGSPHDFDMFSTDAMGTGEGNQAYGWGLYFTDTIGVAEHYRLQSSNDISVNGFRHTANGKYDIGKTNAEERAVLFASTAIRTGEDLAGKANWVRGRAREVESNPNSLTVFQKEAGWGEVQILRDAADFLEEWSEKRVEIFGRMFEVDLPEADEYILWDERMSAQPKVKEAIGAWMDSEREAGFRPESTIAKTIEALEKLIKEDAAGADIIGAWQRNMDKRSVSMALKENGIKGTKYLDRNSRGRTAGTPTYNYVIYDDKDVAVREKYSLHRNLLGDGVVDKIIDRLDGWRTNLQDRMLPLLRAQQRVEDQSGIELDEAANPYLAEELMSGKVGARLERLTDEMVSPLFNQMKAEGVDADELETYLYARHATERNARISQINADFDEGTGSGMTDAEATGILVMAEAEGKLPALERLADKVDAMLKFAVQTRVEAGLLSEEEADAWAETYEYYVPLRGFAEVEPEAGEAERPRFGSGINVRGPESKRAFGRKSKAADILAYSIMQAEEAIVRAGRNEVAQAFYAMVKANPDDTFWTTKTVRRTPVWNAKSGTVSYRTTDRIDPQDEPYTVSLKIDGQERRVTMNRDNPKAVQLATAMRNLSGTDLGSVMRFLSGVNRYLSFVNTGLNPEFVITNAFRDMQTAGINLAQFDKKGLIAGTLKDYRKALVASVRGSFKNEKTGTEWAKWYREFLDNGGRVYFNQVDDLNEIRDRIAKQMTAKSGTLGVAKSTFTNIKNFIENANMGVENAIRLSAYKNARERGMSPAQAASLAKNLTVNFNRRGAWGTAINSLYLFYNASVQGSARLMQAAFAKGKGGNRVRMILGGAVAIGFALDALNAMLSDDDDDGESYYDKVSDFDKSRNLIIMLPGEKGKHFKIPLPYGYNAFFALGRSASQISRGEDWKGAAGGFLQTVVDAFNPIGGTDNLMNLIAPTIADPVVDLYRNRDFADRPIMPEQSPYAPETPDSQKYWDSISPHWKIVTDTLNSMTGGDEVIGGAIDVSPETLQHLSGVATGAAGTFFIDRIGGLAEKAISGEEITANDLPLVRKVVGTKPSWYDKAAYYERVGQIENIVADVKEYRTRQKDDLADAYEDKNMDVLDMVKPMKAAKKQLRALKKERGEIEMARDIGDMTDEDARAEIGVLREEELLIIQEFNAEYIATVAKPKRP